ncbi:MAG: cupin domain-containing protein [Prolixibacteraceae bacterium]|jgi:transcriptional regulator with XRE-family HTH domain|nr:cupin domain-containing protein [Prolixibacteraceae bacterium]
MAKKNVGEKISEIRKKLNINIDELAFRSNLDIEQIQQIEDNTILPSLSPLIKIARSLGVRLGTFLDETEQLGPVVTLAEEKNKGASFSNKNLQVRSHMDFFALASNKASRHMEPFIIDIKPDVMNENLLSSHEGEEFIYVLNGSIEINYGKEIYVLNTGDSIYYDSIVNHNVHAHNNEIAKIIAVIYTPT